MTKRRRRKCLNCRRLFRPDPCNVRHQRYCSAHPCRKARKVASQARWLSKPENRNYFRGPEHVARVRAWRAANPGYGRRGRSTLQDDSYAKALVLKGLIASLTGTALQENIARSARRFQQLALDILKGEPRHGEKTPAPPRAAARRPEPVQLARSPPGA